MKKIGELAVGDYMTPQAIVIDDTARLTKAIRLMDSEGLSVLPVVNEQGDLVGILSTSDLIELTREIQADLSALHHVNEQTQDVLIQLLIDRGDNIQVRTAMSSPAVSVTKDMNMVVAARKMMDRSFHSLPVVEESGKPVGILTTSDFVRVFADHSATVTG